MNEGFAKLLRRALKASGHSKEINHAATKIVRGRLPGLAHRERGKITRRLRSMVTNPIKSANSAVLAGFQP